MEMQYEDIRPLVEVRKLLYEVLKRSFMKEPTQADLNFVKRIICANDTPFLEESALISKGAEQVKTYCQLNDTADEGVYDRLHWDYTRLFVGPLELPAPPWESVYRNKDRLLFQEETLRVRRFYLKYFLLPVEYGQEADDHLGLELDFMSHLNELTLKAIDQREFAELIKLLTDQQLFLAEHLLQWAPELADKVITHAQTDYFRGMAKLLKGFLILDGEALAELLKWAHASDNGADFPLGIPKGL